MQVPLHGPRAEEEPSADLRVRQAIARQPRDLALVRSQFGAGLRRPRDHVLARRLQLLARALGESLHPDRGELVVSGAKLGARVGPAMLAAQPLAVEQVR